MSSIAPLLKYLVLILLMSIGNLSFSQDWTWMKGSNTVNSAGVYGTQGVGAAANTPGPREGAVQWTDNNNNLWLFGGRNVNDYYNDLWKYNITTNQWTWMKGSSTINPVASYGTQGVSAATNVPGPRNMCVTWVDANNNLWLFGGSSLAGTFGDLWKYNITTNQWTWMKGLSTNSFNGVYGTINVSSAANYPGARAFANGWEYNNELYLFGGGRSDLWKYNIASNQWIWIKGSSTVAEPVNYGTINVSAANNTPGSRVGTTQWDDGNGNFYLFGGVLSTNIFCSDVWKYSVSLNQWVWIKGPNTTNNLGIYGTQGVPAVANNPGARQIGAGIGFSGNALLLYGGYGYTGSGSPNYLNDLWKLDLTTLQWTYLKGSALYNQAGIYGTQGVSAATNKPSAREYHISWGDNSGNFWLFGGWGYGNSATFGRINDLWKYQNLCPSMTSPSTFSICSSSAVNLNLTSTIVSTYTWVAASNPNVTGESLTTQTTSTINNTLINTTSTPQTVVYTVTPTATSGGCTGTPQTVTVTVNPTPTVIVPSVTICADFPATMTATPGVAGTYSYAWTVPAGATNPGNIQSFTTTMSGTYFVVITNTNGCSAYANGYLTINPLPTVTVNSPTVCAGTQATITATPGVVGTYNYAWTVPAGATAPGNVASFSTTIAGTYSVVITNTATFCISPYASVTINPTPNVNAGLDLAICAGASVTLTGSGAAIYTWTGGVSNGVSFAPTTTTTYTVTGTNANGCTGSDQIVVIVNPTPNVNAGSDLLICAGTSVTLTGSGAAIYTWTGGVSNGVSFVPTTTTTTYTVTGTNANGCTGSDQIVVTVNPTPTVNAGPNQTVCAGSQIVLSGTGAATYSWNGGVVNNVPFMANTTTNYTLTGISNGCAGTDQVLVTVLPAPNVNAGVNQTICVGNQVVLSAIGATTYSWNNGVTNGVPFSPGVGTMTYTVIGTGANGCTKSDQVVVTVNPGPQINAGPDIAICPGDNVTLYIPVDTSTVVVATSSSGTYVADSSAQPYTNTIPVSGFPAGSQITSAADLQQVCFNFEHSYLGDLDIWLQCPSGQYVPLVNSYNLGTGGFLPGGAGGGGVYLGDPIDDYVGPPGAGWEYCFSSVNATSGIFMDNIFNTIQLSVANGNNSDGFSMDPGLIYLPETSFSSLAGCPINGNWTLFIEDEWQIDDGYVFDWSLDFGGTVNPGSVGTVTWNNSVTNNVTFIPSTTTTYTATATTAAGCVGTDQVIVTVLPASACNNGNGNGTFSNATSPMPFQQANFVPTVIDHNNDGKDDVFGYILNQPNTNKLWINNGNSTFSDISVATNFPTRNNAMVADFDKNGYSDIYYKVGDSILIYLNQNNTYQAATSPCGVQKISTLFGIAPTAHRQVQFNDFNNDGVHDLLVQIQSGNQSILKGIPGQLGCQAGCAFSLVGPAQTLVTLNTINNVYTKFADLDNDGDMDIMLGYGANQYQNTSYNLYTNDGLGNFTQVTGSNYTAGRENAFGTVGELNNDGIPDILSGAADCCIAGDPMYVHFSNTPMNYTVSTTALPRYLDPYYQRASLVDLNLDSRNDVVWVSMAAIGSSQLQYYVNNGNNTFTESSTLYNIHEGPLTGECCAIKNFMHAVVIDINCDKKPDLDIRKLDDTAPYTNTTDWVKLNGTPNNALKLKLDACQGLREGWGAHLKFKTGGQWHYQQHTANTQDGYPFLYLGMGTNTMIDSLVIYWVGGNTSVLTNVVGNQYISVGETAFCSFGSAVNAQIQPNNNQTVCENDNFTLTANVPNAAVYQWFNNGQAIVGATNNTYVVNSTGNYSFIADNGTSCNVSSDTVYIEALPAPDLVLEILGGQDTLCDSECAYLLADGADQYYWFNGSTLDYVEVDQTGNYWVIGTSTNGCQETDSINIWINSSTDTVLYVSAMDQYSLNGVTYYQTGIFTQTLSNSLGCDSTIMLDLDLSFTGVENLEEIGYSIFPNPATNVISVNSPFEMESPYELLDSRGRIVLNGELIGKSCQISLSEIATGTYFLKIIENQLMIKVVKE
jgi:subtilisin-like proprotein convertase family protein